MAAETVELFPPYDGISQAQPDAKMPPLSCPADAIRNMRLQRLPDGRRMMQSRYGRKDVYNRSFGGAIMGLHCLSVAAGLTFQVGDSRLLLGGAQVEDQTGSTTRLGCCFFLHPTRGFAAQFRDPDTGNYPSADCHAIAFSSNEVDGYHTSGAFCTVVSKAYGGAIGNKTITRVHYWTSLEGGEAGGAAIDPDIEWTAELEDIDPGGTVAVGANPIAAVSVIVYEPFVIVAAARYLYVFAAETVGSYAPGDYIKRYDINHWSWTVDDLEFSYKGTEANPDTTGATDTARGNAPWLHAAYFGVPNVTGPVTTNTRKEGGYYRSAVADFQIRPDTPDEPLEWVQSRFGPDTTENSKDFRTNTFNGGVRGRRIMGMAAMHGVLPDEDGAGTRTLGSFVGTGSRPLFLVTTNTGLGPTGENPDGTGGYANWFQLRADDLSMTPLSDAVFASREVPDAASLKRNWQTSGYYNDIPIDFDGAVDPDNGFGFEATLTSVVCDSVRGDVWVAGIRHNDYSVRGLDGATGAVYWQVDTGGIVPRRCLAHDRANGLIVAVGERNTAWEGSGGDDAMVWWIQANPFEAAAIRYTHDFGVAKNGRCVAVNRAGWVALGTDFIS